MKKGILARNGDGTLSRLPVRKSRLKKAGASIALTLILTQFGSMVRHLIRLRRRILAAMRHNTAIDSHSKER